MASARLPNATYDELYAVARALRVDVSVVIREAIERRLLAERRATPR